VCTSYHRWINVWVFLLLVFIAAMCHVF